ncbi:MAG: alpha/beta hydrolase [Pyrinomonadaceae bacterium]|nr:alpha/beta hydrolase [Pyrinomonadaceae bacterium]
MKRIVITILVLTLTASSLFAQKRRRNRYVVGDLRMHTLKSEVFNNTRKLRVLVPEGYNRSKADYPVLYLNDGQNLFDPKTSQSAQLEWGVDETIHSLVRKRRIEKIIVVGIDNAGRRERANEYLPWKDEFLSPPLENPQGAYYPEFLANEVIPFIESKYRVRKGADNMAIGGSSYGALITLFTLIEKPGMFGGAILESPSFYVDEARILSESKADIDWPGKIFLGVGTNEMGAKTCDPKDESHEAVTDVKKLNAILEGKSDVKMLIDPCGVHSEIVWGRRLTDALVHLFPYKVPQKKL